MLQLATQCLALVTRCVFVTAQEISSPELQVVFCVSGSRVSVYGVELCKTVELCETVGNCLGMKLFGVELCLILEL